MNNSIFTIDPTCSTTRLVSTIKPKIEEYPQAQFKTQLFQPEGENRKGEGGLRTRGYFKHSYHEKPLVSIITVVFNGAAHLDQTIQSILNQNYDNVEFIIIDGGSTDETLEIIQKYENKIDYWVSESDSGIYNAMNKGIILASGVIIGIVNADDCIYAGTLQMVADAILQNPSAGFTCGMVDLADEAGCVFGRARPLRPEEIPDRMYREMPFPHQGIYVCSWVYKQFGAFCENYRLSADYDLLLRWLELKVPYIELSHTVGFFRMGGQSGGLETFRETRLLLRDHDCSWWWIQCGYWSSFAKIMLLKLLPRRAFLQFKRLRSKSTSEWFE